MRLLINTIKFTIIISLVVVGICATLVRFNKTSTAYSNDRDSVASIVILEGDTVKLNKYLQVIK